MRAALFCAVVRHRPPDSLRLGRALVRLFAPVFCEYTYRVSSRRAPSAAALSAGRSYPGALFLHDRRMARSSRGEQSSARIAAFFRGPARMRPKTLPCYQNASHTPCSTYRALACFLITTLFVFRFCRARPLPAHKRAHIRMSAPSRRSRRTSKLKRKGQRKCASCADSRKPRTTLTERIETKPPVRRRPPRRTRPRATANPLRQRHLSKGSRPKATAFAFLPPGKPPEACTVTSVRVFARRGGAAGVEAKCLHDFVQAFAAVALQRKRCGALVRSRRKTGAATSDDAPFTAKQKRSEKAQFAGRKGEICNESPCFCAAWRSRRSGSKMPARFRAGIRDRRLAATLVRGTGLEPT